MGINLSIECGDPDRHQAPDYSIDPASPLANQEQVQPPSPTVVDDKKDEHPEEEPVRNEKSNSSQPLPTESKQKGAADPKPSDDAVVEGEDLTPSTAKEPKPRNILQMAEDMFSSLVNFGGSTPEPEQPSSTRRPRKRVQSGEDDSNVVGVEDIDWRGSRGDGDEEEEEKVAGHERNPSATRVTRPRKKLAQDEELDVADTDDFRPEEEEAEVEKQHVRKGSEKAAKLLGVQTNDLPPASQNEPDSPPSPPPPEVETEEQRLARLRRKVAKELLATEKRYVETLESVVTSYLSPLQASVMTSGSPILEQNDINTIFSNIKTLYELNHKFLQDLQTRISPPGQKKVAGSTEITPIGDLLVAFAPFFKMYTQYVSNHEAATTLLSSISSGKLSKNSKYDKFRRFVEDAQSHSAGSSLESYLITPVQRIPRYQLLTQELIKRTDPEHADHATLTTALAAIKESATFINKAIRQQQENDRIIEIQETFSGNVELVKPGRMFIRQGRLTKVGRKKNTKYYFFLFNDLLAYASRNLSAAGWRYQLHQTIDIDQTFQVEELSSDFNAAEAKLQAQPSALSLNTTVLLKLSDIGEEITEEAIRGFVEQNDAVRINGVQIRDGSAFVEVAAEADASLVRELDGKELRGVPVQITDASAADVEGLKNTPLARSQTSSSPSTTQFAFKIMGHQKSFVVFAETAQEKRDWLDDIQQCLDAKGELFQRQRTTSRAAPAPVMEQVAGSSKCVVCKLSCTFLNRRHCKRCGRIVHKDCSNQRFVLEGNSAKDLQRVCDNCASIIKQERAKEIEQQYNEAHRDSVSVSESSGLAPDLPARPDSAAIQGLLAMNGASSPEPPPRPQPPVPPPRPNSAHRRRSSYSPDKGFNIADLPPEWMKFFIQAGVSKEELTDPESAAVIFEALKEQGDLLELEPTSSTVQPSDKRKTSDGRVVRRSRHYSRDEGFKVEELPLAWRNFFQQTGIQSHHLTDPESAARIYDAIRTIRSKQDDNADADSEDQDILSTVGEEEIQEEMKQVLRSITSDGHNWNENNDDEVEKEMQAALQAVE